MSLEFPGAIPTERREQRIFRGAPGTLLVGNGRRLRLERGRSPPLPWISERVDNVGPRDHGIRAPSAVARASDQRTPLHADEPVPEAEEEERREETKQQDRSDEHECHIGRCAPLHVTVHIELFTSNIRPGGRH